MRLISHLPHFATNAIFRSQPSHRALAVRPKPTIHHNEPYNFVADIFGEKPMMDLNIMSSSKYLVAILSLSAPIAIYAREHHRYECPSSLIEGKTKRALDHVNVYDGPPENLASLIPVPAGKADMWDGLQYVDAYLVCEYKGTDKIIAIHALGATVCKVTDHPSAAFCD